MQKVPDGRGKFDVIWMTLINFVPDHIMGGLPLRRDGAVRVNKSICGIVEGAMKSLLSACKCIVTEFST